MGSEKYEVIELAKGFLVQFHREHTELGRQSVQFVAWLVGFSVAMGALLLTGRERMPYLGGGAFTIIIILLVLAIVAGIFHRIVYHYGEKKTLLLAERLQATMAGFLLGARGAVTEPAEELLALAGLLAPYMQVSSAEEALRVWAKREPERTRREVKIVKNLERLADCLYYLTSVAFMAAIVVLAWILLRHALVSPS